MVNIIDGMPNRDYHAHSALGSTSLKTLATKTPAHFKWDRENPKHLPAFDFGSSFHSLVLEDDPDATLVVEAGTRRGKAWDAGEAEARAEGLYPVLTSEWEHIKAMREAVMANPLARSAFTDHIAERSIFWKEDGTEYKARPDALKPGLAVDLKSCLDATPAEFSRTAYKLGYYISAAHYQDGIAVATGDRPAFAFVNVEKTPPYHVSVVQLDSEALDYGAAMLSRAKRIYAECTAADNWPGHPFQTVSLPTWATYHLEEMIDSE